MKEYFSKKLLSGLLLAALLAGVVFFYLYGKTRVDVAYPVRGPAVQAVYATGTVEPTVMLPIAPRVGARLLALNADEGREVKKDEVLAQLESNELQQTLKDLRAREIFAKQDYERKTTLSKQGYVAKAALDQAKAALDSASAAARAVEAQIGYTKLVAPADGRIIRRDGEIGQMIPANQPVFWLSCCAPLRISAEVDEEDISLVKPEQKVLIRADAFPGQTFDGSVQSITPKGDSVARSYRVRINFDDKAPLMIGMTAETNIIARETKNSLLVPSSAIRQNTVYKIEGGKAVKQQVEVGARGSAQTEILSGVNESDLIVLHPESLKAGGRIQPRLTAGKS